jgi:hypothetical protein
MSLGEVEDIVDGGEILSDRRLIFLIRPIGRDHLFFCEKKHDARCTRYR